MVCSVSDVSVLNKTRNLCQIKLREVVRWFRVNLRKSDPLDLFLAEITPGKLN